MQEDSVWRVIECCRKVAGLSADHAGGNRRRFQPCDDDNPADAFAANRGGYKRAGEHGNGKAETVAGSSDSGDGSSGGSESGFEPLIVSV
jgi:hypothetical protein